MNMQTVKGQKLMLIEKVFLLKSLNIFSDTPENVLADLAPLLEDMELEEGSVIFEEGNHGDSMYIINQGQVEVHKSTKTLALLGEKEVFGELSLIDAEKRSASAKAHTDCHLFKIEQEAFFELLDSRPEIARGLLKMLCKRLRVLNEKFDKQTI